MSDRRMLAVLALLLALVAGLLLILNNLHLPREFTLNWIFDVVVKIILGIILIAAGLIAYGGSTWRVVCWPSLSE